MNPRFDSGRTAAGPKGHRTAVLSFCGILFALSSCTLSGKLPRNEKLFYSSEIRMQTDSTIGKKEASGLETMLEDMARPKPNKRLLGFPFKVWLYYMVGEPRRENDFRSWFRRRFGEPPVFASAKAISSNALIFAQQLENEGYFRSTARGGLEPGPKEYFEKAVYQVNVQPRYYLDSIITLTTDTTQAVQKALGQANKNSLLREEKPYRFPVIQAEQERISSLLRRQGFYYFQPDYVAFLADTNYATRKMRLYVALKPDMPEAARLQYYIRNVFIYPNYTLTSNLQTQAVNDTNRRRAVPYGRRILVVDSAGTYNPKLFRDVLSVRPGRRYNSRAQDLTLSRFINLGTFKFVRNRFQPLTENDTAFLDAHYYLTPYPKKSARLELAGVTKSNNLAGSQLTLGWRNRNSLNRAELLIINANVGIDWLIGGGTDSVGLANYRYGLETTLSFPRLVSPIRFRYDRRQLLPKTNFTLGYDAIIRRNLYTLNQFRGSISYAWQKNAKIEQTFQPLGATYVRTGNFGPLFFALFTDADTLNYNDEELENLLASDQLILNSVYSFNYNSSPRTAGRHTFRTTFNAEPAGNLIGALARDEDEDGKKTLFGVPISQYVRVDADNRYYFRMSPRLTWANRINVGVGVPYGNSEKMPFVKQFFAGGSTSIRAFRPRGVGPGSYTPRRSNRRVFLQDGGGDIKAEFSTELRPQFNKYLQGAVFLDVGNVWMFKDTLTFGSGSVFGKDWYKQLAVGAGAGIRLDFSYFVFRLDLAFPLNKPFLPEGERWVGDNIRFGNRAWRRENLILNIAVGYPF
ncbi:translocation and assembly module lipoprotein TamL [Tellurirhabdus rosea]|uniref:translocation and assembly module lipoprotein TamL n=1 Tax=Tellurirhabdus rosea TaxID=2674997 RepID=UPI00224FC6CD|nr:BamA/TamA family outer membrane protein [Tellurirhabdus rosea]